MSENNLVNLGELSKPATTLVEKISDAVGGVFKPYQIRRVARAEAEAERIRAESAIEITELQQRAFHRWLAEEAKKQDNIETITTKALPDVADTAEPDRIEADWITNFFDKARLVSDAEMQALWANVLAGEANDPGTYSKRTVNYLASLDAQDARHFSALCRFCLTVDSDQIPVVFSASNSIYAEAGISREVLSHLDDIGLIRYLEIGILSASGLGKRLRISYFDEVVELELKADSDNNLNLGSVRLSKVGLELAPLCGSQPVPGFLEYVLREWVTSRASRERAIPSSPYPRDAMELVESVLR